MWWTHYVSNALKLNTASWGNWIQMSQFNRTFFFWMGNAFYIDFPYFAILLCSLSYNVQYISSCCSFRLSKILEVLDAFHLFLWRLYIVLVLVQPIAKRLEMRNMSRLQFDVFRYFWAGYSVITRARLIIISFIIWWQDIFPTLL